MKKLTKQIKTVISSHNFYKNKISSLGIDSYSGRGSCIDTTEDIRKHLPLILDKFNIKSIVDAPCGDWNWMKMVDLSNVTYTGYDVVEEILEMNKNKHEKENVKFYWKDLINESFVDKVDLIICRDFMFHIDNDSVIGLLKKFKESGSKYLLSTTFEKTNVNTDIKISDNGYGFRFINLMKPPFNMGECVYSFIETHPDNAGRGMYLWKLND